MLSTTNFRFHNRKFQQQHSKSPQIMANECIFFVLLLRLKKGTDKEQEFWCTFFFFDLLDHFQNTLTLQMRFKHIEQRELLFRPHSHAQLQELMWRCRVHDERCHVNVHECGHQELTVESVHDASVAGDRVSEVLIKVNQ